MKNIIIFVDNLSSPTIIEIIQGTFIIFAGDADSDVSIEIVKKIPPHYGIHPTNEKWVALAKKIHKENLKSSIGYDYIDEYNIYYIDNWQYFKRRLKNAH